ARLRLGRLLDYFRERGRKSVGVLGWSRLPVASNRNGFPWVVRGLVRRRVAALLRRAPQEKGEAKKSKAGQSEKREAQEDVAVFATGLESRSVQRLGAEPDAAADGAGMTAFREVKSLQPAPQLNCVVRPPEGVRDASALSGCDLHLLAAACD